MSKFRRLELHPSQAAAATGTRGRQAWTAVTHGTPWCAAGAGGSDGGDGSPDAARWGLAGSFHS